MNHIVPKLESFGYGIVADTVGHYMVQGHSRSPLSVAVERL